MSPQPEPTPAVHADEEFSPDERRFLLKLAHEAIDAVLCGREADCAAPSDHLGEKRGAFTTLHLGGHLRGCVGYVFPVRSLCRTVAETAVSAAFHDTRFVPVTAEEAQHLEIEISVLSPLQPIAAEDVEVGRHGLVVTLGARRGLLLPQVPTEYNWDRETFLAETCHKAGLPEDAWQHGATLEAFTAEVFRDLAEPALRHKTA
jgi:AmmeMemoRadiSam system protein A